MISEKRLEIIKTIEYRTLYNRLVEIGANVLKEHRVSEGYVVRPLYFLYLNDNLTKEEFIFRVELMGFDLKRYYFDLPKEIIRQFPVCRKVNPKLPKGYKYEKHRSVGYWLSIGLTMGAIATFYKGFFPYAEMDDNYYNIAFNLNEEDFK